MPGRRPRPCLDCGTLTRNPSRCDDHQAAWDRRREQARGSSTDRGYGRAWRRVASNAVAEWKATNGEWCPGWGVAPHAATDLTADHIVAKANGGTDDPDNVTVLCRACNGRKRAG